VPVLLIVLSLPDTLEDDLSGSRGSHSPEIVRGVIVVADHVVVVIKLRGQDGDPAGLAINLDFHPPQGIVGFLISVEQSVLKGLDKVIHRDVLVALDGP